MKTTILVPKLVTRPRVKYERRTELHNSIILNEEIGGLKRDNKYKITSRLPSRCFISNCQEMGPKKKTDISPKRKIQQYPLSTQKILNVLLQLNSFYPVINDCTKQYIQMSRKFWEETTLRNWTNR